MLKFISFITALIFILIAAAQTERNASPVTGKDVYRLNCAGCHDANRSGSGYMYPSLQNIDERLTRTEVRNQINGGKGRMPSFSHLTNAEKEALITFLFGEAERTLEVSIKNSGERIFKSNCASCHRATVNDPEPTNVRMMEPAPLAGATKRFSKNEFFRILETGVCYMPSFNHFTSEEKEALYSFVQSLEGKGEPSRATMGERCPMMMRMRGQSK